jgi:hypothetical protein
MMRKPGLVAALALVLAGLIPASAQAADVNVDGLVASGLSLSVATPSALVLFPNQTNTSVANSVVTSTATSWTLSIKDDTAAGYPSGHTAGHLAKLSGSGPTCSALSSFAGTLSELNAPLAWSATGGNSGNLTGTNQTVKTGSLIQTVPVTYSQAIGATEAVAVNDCYRVVITYTAS